MMLADNVKTERFHAIFKGVPRKAKAEPEARPIETICTTSGLDFYIKVFITGVQGFIVAYIMVVGIGFIFALINMATGSCGQDTWKTDASEACNKMITNTLALSLELRCFADKPPNMLQKDFDETCGIPWGMLVGVGILIGVMTSTVSKLVMALPVKANFHEDFFTVESWSGKKFEASFYADVTHARTSSFGLKITTKAKASLNAGGADDKKSYGKTLNIAGDSIILVVAGHGASGKKNYETFEKYLPLSINGFSDGQAAKVGSAAPRSSSSLFDGRLQEILDVRKADAKCFQTARIPVTADLFIELAITVLFVLIAWYVFSRIPTFFFWAMTKGQNKCTDPMRPDADMCAVYRIFLPVDVPLVNASDYINIVLAVIGILAVPAYMVVNKDMEYRLHQSGAMQDLPLGGWEWQNSNITFPEDVEGSEILWGNLEKVLKIELKACYSITQGISKPFSITANFRPKAYKMSFIDPGPCGAAMCGQRQVAEEYKEKLIALVDEFKPNSLKKEADMA